MAESYVAGLQACALPLFHSYPRVPVAAQRDRAPTAQSTHPEGDMTMSVLDRSELQASPLAHLHAITAQRGIKGFRRLRKADLIDAILGESSGASGAADRAAAAATTTTTTTTTA